MEQNLKKRAAYILFLFGLIGILLNISINAELPSDNQLIAYYDFENNTGDKLIDIYSGKHNGTNYNSPTLVTNGINGNAYSFNATESEYIVVADDDRFDINYYTITGWVNMSINATTGTFLSKGFVSGQNTAYLVRRQTATYIWGSYDGTWRTMSYNTFGLGKWYFFALTHNSTGVFLYINGTLVDSYTGSFTTPVTSSAVSIGADNNDYAYSNYLTGILDEIAIYNRSLSNEEIIFLYNSSSGVFYNPISEDSIYPIFSNIDDNNGTGTGTGNFNVSIDYTNGTAWLRFNNVDYPANNLSSSLFNVSISDISPGIYTYYWYAYGNGSNNNLNNTEAYYFTETDIIAPNLTIISPLNQSYSTTEINFTTQCLDASRISSVWFTLDNGATNNSMSNLLNYTFELGNEWTMLGQNLSNNWFYRGNVDVNSMQNIWNYTTNAEMYGGPVIKNGIVYFATMLGEGGPSSGSVFALNSTTGAFIWRYNGTSEFPGTPTISNDAVWIGSDDYNVYKLNATNGSLMCNFTTSNYVPSNTKILNGVVYVGGYDGKEYALNETDCSQLYSATLSGSVQSQTAISKDYIYVGTDNNIAYKLYASNLTQVWNFTATGKVYAGMTVDNDKVYFGTLGNVVYILNDTDGSMIANFTANNSITAPSLAVAKGAVYANSYDNNIYKLNSTDASLIWATPVTNYGGGPIIVLNNNYVIATTSYGIVILNDNNGSIVKNFSFGNYVYGSAIIDNYFYATSLDKQLHAFSFDFAPTTTNLYNATNSSMSLGSHTARFYCNDTAGNINDTESVSFYISEVDNIELIYYGLTPASTYTNNRVGSDGTGERFNVTANISMRGFTVVPEVTATACHLKDSSGAHTGVILANGSINASHVCNLNYNLTAGTTYRIIVDSNGSSYTSRYHAPFTYPSTNGSITWLAGVVEGYGEYGSVEGGIIDLFAEVIPDNAYPQFSNYYANNGTGTGIGFFNVTLTNTNGIVWLKFNNVNYSASNSSGDSSVFNVTITGIAHGVYNYTWYAYGNGTDTHLNNSENFLFTELDITAPNVIINSPLNKTYLNNTINFLITCTDFSGIDSAWYSLNNGATNYSMNQNDSYQGITDTWEYQGNSQNTGTYNKSLENADKISLLWEKTFGGQFFSSPIVAEGKIYIGTMTPNNTFFSINATTGDILWGYNAVGGEFASTGAYSKGIVYVGNDNHKIYAFNSTDGSLIWFYDTGNYVDGIPLVENDVVYLEGYNTHVYAFNATNGSIIWDITTNGPNEIKPALYQGVLYVGSSDSHVYALNSTDGSQIWNYTLGGWALGVTIYDDKLYAISTDSKVYALYLNGSLIWDYTTGGALFSYTTAKNGVIYIGSTDNNFYALNSSDGSQIWNYTTGGDIANGNAIITDNDLIIFGSEDKNLYILNATTGSKIWNYTTSGVLMSSSPAIANGIIFIGNRGTGVGNGKLYAFNSTSQEANNPFYATNSSMSNGSQTVNYYCNDTVGNVNGSESVSFYIPLPFDINITILNPLNNSYFTNNNINFTINITSANDLANTTLYIFTPNGTIVNTTTYSPGIFQTLLSIPITLVDGIHYWFVKAFDVFFENSATSAMYNFIIDTAYPQIQFVSPTLDNGANVSQNYIAVNVSVIEANQANITFSLYNGSSVNRTVYGNTNYYTINNLTFVGNENITTNISIYRYANIINASLNLSGYISTNYCYQEFANVSTGCGGLNTGVYMVIAGTHGATNEWYDGNWDSYKYMDGASLGYLYVNYSKPFGATNNSLIQVKSDVFQNYSIPSNCWDAYSDKIVLRFTGYTGSDEDTQGDCYNGTDWLPRAIYSDGGLDAGKFYEEAMIWSISSYPTNPYVLINNTNVWNYPPSWWNYADLVAYWKFNQGSGDAVDISGRGHTMTNNNMSANMTYAPGKLNNATVYIPNSQFNASDSADWDFGTGNFTVAFWYKTEALGAPQNLILADVETWMPPGTWAIYSGLYASPPTTSVLTFGGATGGWLSFIEDETRNGSWHRIVWVREGTGAEQTKLYINGVLKANATNAGDYNAGTGIWSGAVSVFSDSNMSLDDIQIYKGYAWTTADISTDWNNGIGREAPTSGTMEGNVISSDFSSTLNTALNSGACDCSGCKLIGDTCNINITFHSDTTGTLYSKLTELIANNPLIYNHSWTNLTNGIYSYQVNITDLSGFSNATELRTIVLDTTSPSIDLFSPTNGTYLNNSNVNLTLSISDNLTGIKNATFYLYNSTGWINSSWGKRTTLVLDNYPNQLNLTYLTGMNADFSDIRFYSGDCHSASQQLQYKLSQVGNSIYAITWIASVPSSKKVCLYYNNPFATDGQNTSLVVGNSSLTSYNFGQIETSTGVPDALINKTTITSFSNIFDSLVSVYIGLTDRVYKWFAEVFDFAGNSNYIPSQLFIVDTIKPGINFVSPTSPNGASSSSGILINVSIVDENPANTTIYLYNSSYTTCYQETANVSAVGDGNCGLTYTGNYNCPAGFCSWTNFSSIIDGDWNTSSYGTVLSYLIVNYTKPVLATGGALQIETGLGYQNLSIPLECWDADSNKISFLIYSDTNGIYKTYVGCWNGINYTANQLYYASDLSNLSYGLFYEEAMIWNIGTLINSTTNYNWNNLYTNYSVPNGIYYYRADSYDYSGWSNYTTTRRITVNIPPIITWVNQVPADISSNNTFGTGLNVTYTITATGNSLNTSTIRLYYTTNKTSSPYNIFINGTGYSGWNSINYTSNNSDNYLFMVSDNQIYPATYNFPERDMELTPHQALILNNNTEWARIELLNLTGNDTYNQFEIMANATSNASGNAEVYFCNSTYSSGDPSVDNSCTLLSTFSPSDTYNHCHSEYSCHYLIPVVIIPFDVATGLVNNQTVVTSSSNFLMSGGMNGSWNVYYITNGSRAGAARTSIDNGITWNTQTYTFDAHLHIYDGTDTFYYFVNASTIYDGTTTSLIHSDYIDLGGLPPSPPSINYPVAGYYKENINISYDASISPNGYNISYYNISLLNSDATFNHTIQGNNSLNLSYNWNTLLEKDDNYLISVRVYDQYSQTSFALSKEFTIDNTYPLINFDSGTTLNGSYIKVPIDYSITINDTYLSNITVRLYNWLGNIVNSTVISYGPGNISATLTGIFPLPFDGNYYFNATTCDYAGNCNSTETRMITYDITNPTIVYSNPTLDSGGPYSTASIWINATANDTNLQNISVHLELSMGGLPFSDTQSVTTITTPQSLFYNWTGLSQGIYNMYAWAYDKAGNVQYTSTNKTINIDTEAPYINYSDPTPVDGYHTARTYFMVNITADDPNFANQTIYYWYENGLVQTQTTTAKTNSLNQTGLADGTYYYNASAIDISERVAWLPTRSIVLEGRSINISICKELSLAEGHYKVLADLSSSEACLNVTAENIMIDCQGHTISGKPAILVTKPGFELRNCILTASSSTALKLQGNSPADAIIYNSTFTGSTYGIYVAPEAKINADLITVTNNQYGIYFNGSENGNIIINSMFSDNTEDTLTFLRSSSNVISNISMTLGGDTSNDGVIKLVNSSDNNFSDSSLITVETKLFGLYNYSVNNLVHSCTYFSSTQDYVDGTSHLIREWEFIGYVIDKVENKIDAAIISYAATNPTNQNVTYEDGRIISYETLGGSISTNDRGLAYGNIVQYMNIYGINYTSSPYNFNVTKNTFEPKIIENLEITNNTYQEFQFIDEIGSSSLSRTAIWLLLGIIYLIGMAASIGFFITRMREGYSVVDIWKYFIIFVIWTIIFTIIYFVLSGYVMGMIYPTVNSL